MLEEPPKLSFFWTPEEVLVRVFWEVRWTVASSALDSENWRSREWYFWRVESFCWVVLEFRASRALYFVNSSENSFWLFTSFSEFPWAAVSRLLAF